MLLLGKRSGSYGGFFRNPFQLKPYIVRSLKAVVRMFCEAGVDKVFEGRRGKRLNRRNRFGIFFQNRAGYANLALTLERPLAASHFIERRTQGEQIRARVSLFTFNLLRRHVLNGADDRTGGSEW